jgi:hypothetical protein
MVQASLSDPGLVITASNGSGTATLPIPLSQFGYDPLWGEWSYFQAGQVNLFAPGGSYIAKIKNLTAFMVDDPSLGVSIILQYGLIAGTSLTNFSVDSGVVSFPAIPAALSAANMSDTFTLTELNYDTDNFAQVTALNNYAYKTYYGQAGSPNEFFFHGSDSVGQFGGYGEGWIYNAYDNWPVVPGAYENLGISVDRIRTQTAFSLTQLDEVQVQHTFMLNVPEPATVGLLTLGGLLLISRRRR